MVGRIELYISGNFTELNKEWGGIHTFHGYKALIMVKIIKMIFKKAKRLGIPIGTPKPYCNWGWGLNKDESEMEYKEFVGVFLYHMSFFLEAGEKFPNCIVRSDNCDEICDNPLIRFIMEDNDYFTQTINNKILCY